MFKNKQLRSLVIFSILAAAILVAVTLTNISFARNHPGGNDFLVHWVGTQSFFADGTSPYSDATALKIQTLAYGRAALPGERELRVAYPLYTMFLFAPFALIKDYAVARGLWMTLLEGCLVAIALVSLKLVRTRTPFWLVVVSVFFVLFSYHGVRPLINGNAVIVISLLILLALYAVINRQDEIAGVLLAFATINPQNAILVVAFVLIWALIQHRKTIVYWFLGTMTLLVGFSMLLIPDWIVQNLREILRYSSYNLPGSPEAMMAQAWGDIGMRLSVFVTVIIAGILLAEWVGAFRGDERHFLWAALLTVALSQWIGIQTDPGNFVLLFPGILFSFVILLQRWGPRVRPVILAIIGALLVGLWALFLVTLQKGAQPVQSPALFFPFPLVTILLLYWTKWWAIRPLRSPGQY